MTLGLELTLNGETGVLRKVHVPAAVSPASTGCESLCGLRLPGKFRFFSEVWIQPGRTVGEIEVRGRLGWNGVN